MLEEVDRLASLVDRLLTLSRAEMGVSNLSRDDIELRGLAEEVVSHLSVLAEEKKQSITVDGSGSPHASGDRFVIRQAVINLVDNAIKFSQSAAAFAYAWPSTPRGGARRDRQWTGIERGATARSSTGLPRRHSHERVGGIGLGISIARVPSRRTRAA